MLIKKYDFNYGRRELMAKGGAAVRLLPLVPVMPPVVVAA